LSDWNERKRRICYLSLGANLGQRGETMREALRRLAAVPETRLTAVSPFYETAPWGKLDQPSFLNTAAALETNLPPLALLKECQRIEKELGRVRHEHWGARTIDIDLLHMPGVQMDTPELRLPHPYLTQRAFVLRPLADIAGDVVILGRTVQAWSRQAEGQGVFPSAELAQPWPLKLVACIDAAGGLGLQGKLLVHLPEDMAHFRQLTLGQTVIMGRRTMESLPQRQPLPDRTNIVMSRQLSAGEAPGFTVCHTLLELWQALGRLQREKTGQSFWCIGGAEVYAALLPYVHEAQITRLKEKYPADCFFPLQELESFTLVCEEPHEHCVFQRYEAEGRMLLVRESRD
jgi:2-amino-4-hydroxy-6-hydroxymethyldihydropteridine diphosphokinase